ncbi:hypothetical protein ACFFRR_007986 [Megaselia abdita]
MSLFHKVMSFGSSLKNPLKMALVVRTDLKMTKGKIAAQCSHAAIMCYQESMYENGETLRNWVLTGQPKIVVKVDSLEQMKEIFDRAVKDGVTAKGVMDAGKTQLEPGTETVIGLGPDDAEKIDKIVGHLKLL